MKKKSSKSRNAFAIKAKSRKAGKMRSKKEKRQNGTNDQLEFLKEIINEA